MARVCSRESAYHSRLRIERGRELVAGGYYPAAQVLADDMTRELGKLAGRKADRPTGRPVGPASKGMRVLRVPPGPWRPRPC